MSVFWRPRGCVLWYDFAELQGDTVYDLSGNGNHGTIYNCEWRRGHLVGSLYFNGTDAYVEVPDDPSNQLGNEGTLEALVKPLGSTGVVQDIIRRHYILGWVSGSNYNNWRCWIWDGSSWRFFNYPEPLSNYIGEWVFTAFTYKYGDKARVWVNDNYIEYDAPYQPVLRGSNWGVGWGGSDCPSEYFHGLIAFARIYNRALTPREIKAHYHYLSQKYILHPALI